ncbi:MAG: glycerophosphodiester phosphodiesterase [Acholeplasma sp.]|nr:glycerophosphodiester phosphodiesterase [Acholeplasma sp.]
MTKLKVMSDVGFAREKYDQLNEQFVFESNVIAPAVVWTEYEDIQSLKEMVNNELPLGIIIPINDSNLTVGNDKAKVYEVIDLIYPSIIPIFKVEKMEVVEKLMTLINEKGFIDYFVYSKDANVILFSKEKNYYSRGVLEVSVKKKYDLKDFLARYNRSNSQILYVKDGRLLKDEVSYLQKRGVVVFTSANDDQVSLYQTMISGVNGINVIGDYKNLYDIYKEVPENTIVRNSFSIAHRGFHKEYPENTIESGKEAIRHGAEIIELDVRLTKDYEVVVIHDSNTANVSDTNVAVNSMWSKLSKVELRNKFNEKIYIPKFHDYLKEFKDEDVVIFVEIKENSELLVEKTVEIIEELDMASDVVIIAFAKDSLLQTKKYNDSLSLGLLVGDKGNGTDLEETKRVVDYVLVTNSSYNPSHTALNYNLTNLLMARGIGAWPWTINGNNVYNEQLNGSMGITTDSSDVAGLLPINIERSIEIKKNVLVMNSIIYTRSMNNINNIVKYSILNDSENILVSENLETFRFEKKGKAFLIGSFEYEYPNGVKVNYLIDFIEVDNEVKWISYVLIGIGTTITIGLLIKLIINNKKRKGEK